MDQRKFICDHVAECNFFDDWEACRRQKPHLNCAHEPHWCEGAEEIVTCIPLDTSSIMSE